MSEETITLRLNEATPEQLQKALDKAIDSERRCNEQGSWWHTWATRRERLETALATAKKRRTELLEQLAEEFEKDARVTDLERWGDWHQGRLKGFTEAASICRNWKDGER